MEVGSAHFETCSARGGLDFYSEGRGCGDSLAASE